MQERELENEQATDLPERTAMTTIMADPVNSVVDQNLLSPGAQTGAFAQQDVPIVQDLYSPEPAVDHIPESPLSTDE
jgi:hypothetical protein